MKKSTIKKWLIAILFFVFSILITNSSKAATLSVTTSKTSVSPGESFSITVSVSGGAGKVNITATNASISQTTLDLMLQSSATVTCTAGSSGTISINANGVIADYSTEKDETLSAPQKNVSIVQTSDNNNNNNNNSNNNNGNNSVITPTEKSNIATLSNLGIRPNDFSGFSPSKTSYSVTVPNEVESVEVYANKGQSGQTITGTGTKKLTEGANTVNIVVTAEDGKTTKTYTINITRDKEKEDDEEEEKEKQTVEEPIEENFGLTELKIEGLELQPGFQTDVYEYKIELKEDIEKLDITTLSTETNASIEITGNENLQEGENIVTIIVKSENEEKTAAYQIIVNKTIEENQDIANQEKEQQEKTKKIIIISAAGGAILLIILVVIIVKVKKSKAEKDIYIPYGNILDTYTEELDEDDTENEAFEEEHKKKKHSKGKRYK